MYGFIYFICIVLSKSISVLYVGNAKRRCQIPLEVKLQAAMWVLRIKLKYSGRAVNPLNSISFLHFETRSEYVAQADLTFVNLLPQSP